MDEPTGAATGMRRRGSAACPARPLRAAACGPSRMAAAFACAALVSAAASAWAQDDAADAFRCLPADQARSIGWHAMLLEEARALEARWQKHRDELGAPEAIRERQRELRRAMTASLGGFPDHGPLEAVSVGTIPRAGYRIEKVIFASRPGHRITANLYLPAGPGPFPGVSVSSGHSRTAKTADYNQRFGIALSRAGIAALCYDPIGQGERSQILTTAGVPAHEGTTVEHQLIGTGSILVGRNTATYRTWDGIRALDYLASRPEIDSARLGMTGCSGGGTLTSYVMALDDRVACAAPACYLTSFQRLLDTIGPQDAEQVLHAQLRFGIDHPDYIVMRAPRPTLVSATTGDFFDVIGTWHTVRAAKRIYTRLGAGERLDIVEADGKHGVQPANLAAIVQWMQRWLAGRDEPAVVADFADFPLLPEADLLCTPRGQVLHDPGERSVFELNAEAAADLAAQRPDWSLQPAAALADRVREVAGIGMPGATVLTAEPAGVVTQDGHRVEKVVLRGGSGGPLPTLVFRPATRPVGACLILHDAGKVAAVSAGGVAGPLARGLVAVVVDLRGQGETARYPADPLLGDWRTSSLAFLLGRSVVGAHAEDIMAAAAWAAAEHGGGVHLVASGGVGVSALHAAFLAPESIASVSLAGTPASWAEIVGDPPGGRWFAATIHGVLAHYDIPDLVRGIGGERVTWQSIE